jgi:hypothetical protein
MSVTRTPEFIAWRHMLERCTDQTHRHYHLYGGRGIKVCKRWLVFANFLADLGPKPTPQHTLERKKNWRGYSPSNCVWATMHEQRRNTRANHWLTLNGERHVLEDWATILGINEATIRNRLRAGKSVKKALLTPVDTRFRTVRG